MGAGVLLAIVGLLFFIRKKRDHQLADRVEAQQLAFNHLMEQPGKSVIYHQQRNNNTLSTTRFSGQSEISSPVRQYATLPKATFIQDPKSISFTEALPSSYSYMDRLASTPDMSASNTQNVWATSILNMSTTSSRDQNSESSVGPTSSLSSLPPTQSSELSGNLNLYSFCDTTFIQDPKSISFTEALPSSYSYMDRLASTPDMSASNTQNVWATSILNMSTTSSRDQNSESSVGPTSSLSSLPPTQSSELSGNLNLYSFCDSPIRRPQLRISEQRGPSSIQWEFKDSNITANSLTQDDPIQANSDTTSIFSASRLRDSTNSLNDSRVRLRTSWQSDTSIIDQAFSDLVRENSIYSENDRSTDMSDVSVDDFDSDIANFSLLSRPTGPSGMSMEECDLSRLSECSEGEI
ncbi:hypothetical protein ABG067_004960 [Albugo candida]